MWLFNKGFNMANDEKQNNMQISNDIAIALVFAVASILFIAGANWEIQNKPKTEQELKKEYINTKQDTITAINYINQRQK